MSKVKISLFFCQISMSHPSWRTTMMSSTQFPAVLPQELQQPPRSRAQSPVTQVQMWSHPLWADALKISLKSRRTRPPPTSQRQPSYWTRVRTLYLQNRASVVWMDFSLELQPSNYLSRRSCCIFEFVLASTISADFSVGKSVITLMLGVAMNCQWGRWVFVGMLICPLPAQH